MLLTTATFADDSSPLWSEWGEWSECSSSCNGGVTVQKRYCITSNCIGPTKQYKSCNVETCSVPVKDPRDEQCGELIFKIAGQKLQWTPKNTSGVEDLCELFCVSTYKGGQFQINPSIKIGTPCAQINGEEGICLGKLCAPVGCDGILGSQKDKCLRCLYDIQDFEICKPYNKSLDTNTTGGNPVSASIPINGTSVIITYKISIVLSILSEQKTLPSNDNEFFLNGIKFQINDDGSVFVEGPLIEILTIHLEPSSAGKPSVDYEYHLLVDDEIDEEIEGPQNETDYSWIYDDFTSCSVTCGGGTKISHVHCRDSENPEKLMPDSFCHETPKPYPIVRKCLKGDCLPRWVAFEWGICTTQCGEGVQYRRIECWQVKEDGSDSKVENSAMCSHLPKPANSRNCNPRPCYVHWKRSDWGTCSTKCNLGVQQRTVLCNDIDNQPVNEAYCEDLERPSSSRPCNEGPCYYSWHTSEWSECSNMCGSGNRHRLIHCSTQHNDKVSESLCDENDTPDTNQSCVKTKGCNATWVPLPWQPCEGSCGNSQQSRSIQCIALVDDKEVELPDNCNETSKPDIVRTCTDQCIPKWTEGQWGECSVTCGYGYRQRTVSCMQGGIPSNECDENEKPSVTTTCKKQDCPGCADHESVDCGSIKRYCYIPYVKGLCCNTCSI